ncbi:unnamed protein product [Boreogadus saida]
MKDTIQGVERFDSPGKGRGLRVTKPFKVGDLIFSCPAYSFVLSAKERGSYCEYCFNRKEGLARCGKCKKACYCNATCQRADWSMHKLECSSMVAYGPNWCPSETVRLVARILAAMKTQKERNASENLMLIGEMQTHVEDVDNARREVNESEIAGLHRFYSKHLDFPDHSALLALFSQVACNGFTVEDEELSHMGTAVYPDVALINHSCQPSVIVTFKGTTAEVRAVTPMKKMDEVMISYIDILYPTDDRNSRLRDSYYFTCDCQECKTKSKDKAKLKVRKRSDPYEPEVVSGMVRYARKKMGEFRAIKSEKNILLSSKSGFVFLDSLAPPSELLEMCVQSLDEMGTVFDDANVYMLHMMYQAMGVCLYLGDWDGAIHYGEKILKPYSVLYPAYSLNVSSMYLKLGRLYMGLEKRSRGLNALKKAMAIMEVAHGKDHQYMAELRKEIK